MSNPHVDHIPVNQCPCGVLLKDDPDFVCDTCGTGICSTCYTDHNPGSICGPCMELARDKAADADARRRANA